MIDRGVKDQSEEIAKDGKIAANKETMEEAKNTMEDINKNELDEDKRITELKEEIEVSLVEIYDLFQCLCNVVKTKRIGTKNERGQRKGRQ